MSLSKAVSYFCGRQATMVPSNRGSYGNTKPFFADEKHEATGGDDNQSRLHSGSPRCAESFDPSPKCVRTSTTVNVIIERTGSGNRLAKQKTWYLIRSALAIHVCNEKLSMTRT